MKNINYKFLPLILSTLILITSCGGDSDGGNSDVIPNPQNPPTKPTGPETPSINETIKLVFPLKDEVCTTGVFISETESTVEFKWQALIGTSSYDITLTNLEDNSVQTLTSNTNSLDITLLQNTQYSWKVVSKEKPTEQSALWRLYNASDGERNFAPFPSLLINPMNNISISENSITLEWSGSDPDGNEDIASYDVFLGTNSNPASLIGNTTNPSINSGILNGSTTYFWKVITKDKFGNNTSSRIFNFSTN